MSVAKTGMIYRYGRMFPSDLCDVVDVATVGRDEIGLVLDSKPVDCFRAFICACVGRQLADANLAALWVRTASGTTVRFCRPDDEAGCIGFRFDWIASDDAVPPTVLDRLNPRGARGV